MKHNLQEQLNWVQQFQNDPKVGLASGFKTPGKKVQSRFYTTAFLFQREKFDFKNLSDVLRNVRKPISSVDFEKRVEAQKKTRESLPTPSITPLSSIPRPKSAPTPAPAPPGVIDLTSEFLQAKAKYREESPVSTSTSFSYQDFD